MGVLDRGPSGNSLCSNYQSWNDVGWVKIMKEKETGMQAAESISNSYGNSLCFCAQITSPGMTLGG